MHEWHHDPELLRRETGWLKGLASSLITGKVMPEDISMHTLSAIFRLEDRNALARKITWFLRSLAARIERPQSSSGSTRGRAGGSCPPN